MRMPRNPWTPASRTGRTPIEAVRAYVEKDTRLAHGEDSY